MQSRREFLRLGIVGVPVLLSACAAPPTPAASTSVSATSAPAAPTSTPAAAVAQPTIPASTPQPTVATRPAASSKDPLPTYIPFTGGPKPDYHDGQPIFADGFESCALTSWSAVAE